MDANIIVCHRALDYAYGVTDGIKLAAGKFKREPPRYPTKNPPLCPDPQDDTKEGICKASLAADNADTIALIATGKLGEPSQRCNPSVDSPSFLQGRTNVFLPLMQVSSTASPADGTSRCSRRPARHPPKSSPPAPTTKRPRRPGRAYLSRRVHRSRRASHNAPPVWPRNPTSRTSTRS